MEGDARDSDDTPKLGAGDDGNSVETLSVVWKGQVLGLAFMESTILYFAEVADTLPDFRQLQTIKYTLVPKMIVAPASSDQYWLSSLRTSEFLHTGQLPLEESNEAGLPTDEDKYEVTVGKARDFTVEAALKRLSLNHSLVNLPRPELTEREILLHLQHIIPAEQTQALRAIGGLLAYLQKCEPACSARVTEIRRYMVSEQLFLAPEAFLSLNIFEDVRHPSAHGQHTPSSIHQDAAPCSPI